MRLTGFASLLLAAVMAAGASAQSVDREIGPLMRLFPHWQTYLEIPETERSHFSLVYTIGSNRHVDIDDINIWFELDGQRTEIELDPVGRVLNPPDPSIIAAAPSAWINQPEGGMSVSMGFEARLDPGLEINRADTLLALEQANQAMRRVGGVAALFAPSFKSLVFVFDGAVPEAWAVHEDGHRSPLTVQENQAIYRPRDRELRDVRQLEFGRAALRVLLEN